MPHPAAYLLLLLLLPPPLLSIALAEAAELSARQHNADTPARKARREETGTAPAEVFSSLTLKVWVKDASSQRYLSGAAVRVFVNGSLLQSSQTEENGEVLLTVPYQLGVTLTLVASMEAYVPTQLPWKTNKMPIFSAVTMTLVPQTQGNIWLFEDTVLITRKTSGDVSSQPIVQFPKSLLSLPENATISTVTAYLTVPAPPPEKEGHFCTMGVFNSKGEYMSVKLSPVAVLSTQLLSDGKEIDVRGPIHLTVPLPYHTHLRAADSLPAWAFDATTGTWVNKGIGSVRMERNGLVWTYVAPHLGNWIAAPSPISNGYTGHPASMDFISYNTYLLVGILGGTLVIIIGLLSVILCHCRALSHETERKRWNSTRLSIIKKDQTTSTSSDEVHEPLYNNGDHNGDRSYSVAARGAGVSASPRHQASYNIYVDNVCRPAGILYENIGAAGLESIRPTVPNLYVNSDEVAKLREMSEKGASRLAPGDNPAYRDKLFHIYNQPVAIVQAPEHFSSQGQAESAGTRCATFPRNGTEHGAQAERNLKDSFTQTLPKVQQDNNVQPVLEGPQNSTANPGIWGRYSHLLESVSVPGTLNEAAGMGPFHGELQGISEQTLLELSKVKPSPLPPRAWFVSLDGKPAAQVRHSVIELQGRHRPGSSNDTSLDSGVDMNELQLLVRKSDQEGPSIARMPKVARGRGHEEPDLSSSEIGSPEDTSLRNALESSSAAIPNIPEDQDAGDTSSESRSTPPPRRLRKVRDKRADKKTARHVREERAQTKR